MTFVIFNADDFGYSADVNAAVLKAHRDGVLTSASLMVTEPGWQEAVALAREWPSLGVGLHTVLTYDRPLLPPANIPHLVELNGRLQADLFRASFRCMFSRPAQRELQHELAAQFDRFASTGLPWSHVDGHQHFHMQPVVWDTLLDLCEQYGAHRLRIPHEELRAHFRQGGDGLSLNTVASLALRALRRRNRRVLYQRQTLGGKPVFTCDRVYGQLQTGNMNAAYTTQLLRRIAKRANQSNETCEIYFHPGSAHARALPADQQTESVRDVELAALLDPALRAFLTSGKDTSDKDDGPRLRYGTYAQAEEYARVRQNRQMFQTAH